MSSTPTTHSVNVPRVVHLCRRNGNVIQDCDLYIGRACNMGGWNLPTSKWHNPFNVKEHGRDGACEMYRNYILNTPELVSNLHELQGKTLGCWCKPQRCHGDILVDLYEQSINKK